MGSGSPGAGDGEDSVPSVSLGWGSVSPHCAWLQMGTGDKGHGVPRDQGHGVPRDTVFPDYTEPRDLKHR